MSAICRIAIGDESRVPRQGESCPSDVFLRGHLQRGHRADYAIISGADETPLVWKNLDAAMPHVQWHTCNGTRAVGVTSMKV